MLGVPRTATEKEIRSAYRKLARQHHPDLNPGDKNAEERFKEVNEAHEVLTDADKRKLYDRFGEDWQRYRDAGFTGDEQFTAPGPSGAPGLEPAAARPSTRMTSTSGTRARAAAAAATPSIQPTKATTRTRISLRRSLAAAARHSIGLAGSEADSPRRGHEVNRRPGRRGRNAVKTPRFRSRSRSMRRFGEPSGRFSCRSRSRARRAAAPAKCEVRSVRRAMAPASCGAPRRWKSTFPPGIDSGKRVRMAGQGGPGLNGGPAGDVNLIITVRPDRRFEREGDNLRTEVDVPVTTAVLGGEVEVPTPTGKVALTVPAGTQSGRSFRLRGMGMPKLQRPQGTNAGISWPGRASLPPRILLTVSASSMRSSARSGRSDRPDGRAKESGVTPRIRHRLGC